MAGPHLAALAQLAVLDTLDQERLTLLDEQKERPARVARLEQALSTSRATLAAIAARRTDLTRRIRLGERELEEVARRRDRARARIGSLTSEAQVAATEREIAQLGEQFATQEEVALGEMMAAEEIAEEESEATRVVGTAAGAVAEATKEWAARAPVLVARIAVVLAAIEALVPTIPAEALRIYRVGFENRGNTHPRGGTRTQGIMCVLCRTEIPVLWVNQARTGEGLHQCGGCKRVLLGKAPDAEPEPAPGP